MKERRTSMRSLDISATAVVWEYMHTLSLALSSFSPPLLLSLSPISLSPFSLSPFSLILFGSSHLQHGRQVVVVVPHFLQHRGGEEVEKVGA